LTGQGNLTALCVYRLESDGHQPLTCSEPSQLEKGNWEDGEPNRAGKDCCNTTMMMMKQIVHRVKSDIHNFTHTRTSYSVSYKM